MTALKNYLNNAIRKQYDVYNDIIEFQAPYKILQAVRQSGKTSFLVEYAIAKAQLQENQTIVIATFNHNMVRLIGEHLKETYFKIPAGCKLSVTTLRHDNIGFSNGTEIIVKSIASPDAFRGYAINTLLIDELAFCQSQNMARDVLSYTIPVMRASASEIIIASTRNSRSKKKNVFWNIWHNAINDEKTYGVEFTPFVIRTKDVPHFTREKLRHMKNSMGRTKYEKELTIRMK